MSIVFPYTPSVVINYLSNIFSLDLSGLTSYEKLVITCFSNLYFFVYWFILIYFALKFFNRIWERFF